MDGAAAAGAADAAAAAGAVAAGADGAAPAGGAVGVLAALGGMDDPRANRIAALKDQRAQLLANRKAVQKELKNEERKRQRLMDKARNLSNEDLASVLGSRAVAAAKAKAKAEAKAKAKAKAKAAA